MITEYGTDYWGLVESEPSEEHARRVAKSGGAKVYIRQAGGEWLPETTV